jgi:HEPN domain-containing protein
MRNDRMAIGYLDDAIVRVEELARLFEMRRFNVVVREAQEGVELALKAALRWVGIEPAKVHDVSEILLEEQERFPCFFRDKIDRLAEISRKLARERGRSFYGDEERGVPASDLYSESDALEAIDDARFVLLLCRELIGE